MDQDPSNTYNNQNLNPALAQWLASQQAGNPGLLQAALGQQSGLNPALLAMLSGTPAPSAQHNNGINPALLSMLMGQANNGSGSANLQPAVLQAMLQQQAQPARQPSAPADQPAFTPQQTAALQEMMQQLLSRSREDWVQLFNQTVAQQKRQGTLDIARVEHELQQLMPMLDKNAQLKLREIVASLKANR